MNQHNWSRFAFALISQNTGQRILAVHVGVYCNLRVTNVGLPPAAKPQTVMIRLVTVCQERDNPMFFPNETGEVANDHQEGKY